MQTEVSPELLKRTPECYMPEDLNATAVVPLG